MWWAFESGTEAIFFFKDSFGLNEKQEMSWILVLVLRRRGALLLYVWCSCQVGGKSENNG